MRHGRTTAPTGRPRPGPRWSGRGPGLEGGIGDVDSIVDRSGPNPAGPAATTGSDPWYSTAGHRGHPGRPASPPGSRTTSTASARPLDFELIAGGHSQPHVPGHRRGRPTPGCCAGRRSATCCHRPRHGPRAPHHLRPRADRRAGGAGPRALHRRRGQRRAVLRHGLRRGHHRARRRQSPRRLDRGSAPARRRVARRRAGRASTPSTSTRSGSATSAATRATSPASSSAGTASSSSRRPRELPAARRGARPAQARDPRAGQRPRSSTATTGSTTCMVGDDGDVARRARLGDLHARRPARRRRPAAWSTGPSPATTTPSLRRRRHRRSPASRREPSSLERYAGRSGRDLSRPRLLRRVRVLEAGLHHRGRLRALHRRRHGHAATRAASSFFGEQVVRLAESAAAAADRIDSS